MDQHNTKMYRYQGQDENLNVYLTTPLSITPSCLSSPPRFEIRSYGYNGRPQEYQNGVRLIPTRTHYFDDGDDHKLDYTSQKQCMTSNTDEKNHYDEQMDSYCSIINKLSFPLLSPINSEHSLCTSDEAFLPRYLLIPELSSQASWVQEDENLHHEQKYDHCSVDNNEKSYGRATGRRRPKINLKPRQSRSQLRISTPIAQYSSLQ